MKKNILDSATQKNGNKLFITFIIENWQQEFPNHNRQSQFLPQKRLVKSMQKLNLTKDWYKAITNFISPETGKRQAETLSHKRLVKGNHKLYLTRDL